MPDARRETDLEVLLVGRQEVSLNLLHVGQLSSPVEKRHALVLLELLGARPICFDYPPVLAQHGKAEELAHRGQRDEGRPACRRRELLEVSEKQNVDLHVKV